MPTGDLCVDSGLNEALNSLMEASMQALRPNEQSVVKDGRARLELQRSCHIFVLRRHDFRIDRFPFPLNKFLQILQRPIRLTRGLVRIGAHSEVVRDVDMINALGDARASSTAANPFSTAPDFTSISPSNASWRCIVLFTAASLAKRPDSCA
jgi:hypothetical protein